MREDSACRERARFVGADRSRYVGDGQPHAGEPGRVDLHLDLPLLPTHEIHLADANDALELLLDTLIGDAGKLLNRHVT